MASMSTCTSTQENFKGVTSLMIELVCGPEYIHEEGSDTHVNIYERDDAQGNSDEDGDDIGVFTSGTNVADLDLSYDKKINGGGDSSDNDDENNTKYRQNDEE